MIARHSREAKSSELDAAVQRQQAALAGNVQLQLQLLRDGERGETVDAAATAAAAEATAAPGCCAIKPAPAELRELRELREPHLSMSCIN